MKKLCFTVVLGTTLFGCNHPNQNVQAEQTLSNYIGFVDSVYAANEVWKMTIDTDYVEMLVNPADSAKTKVDTIITLPSSKKSMVVDAFYKVRILEKYIPLKAEVDHQFSRLDSVSQQNYKAARKKFESLLGE
ncbi:MAG: hypothetical protein V4651_10615 [Bacteroidota bacterium]